MSYYQEPNNHIRDKLDKLCLWKELEYATGVDTSDLAAKKDFIALKAEVLSN